MIFCKSDSMFVIILGIDIINFIVVLNKFLFISEVILLVELLLLIFNGLFDEVVFV